MKKLLLLVLLISLCYVVFSVPVSHQVARRVADSFMMHQSVKAGNTQFKSNEAVMSSYMWQNKLMYYIFNYSEGGFVLISGDDLFVPVLAYSFDETFDPDNMAPATIDWMQQYILQMQMAYDEGVDAHERIISSWKELYNNTQTDEKNYKAVTQLLTTRWNQNYPYNMFCPFHPLGPGQHCYAGCVATAMSQVMKYYNYPETGRFEKTYFWGDYFTVDFGATTYAWDEMSDFATSLSREAIAELMYHCGVASNMNYGHDGSGTQVELAMFALKHYFRYRADCVFEEKDNYDDETWRYMLQYDLDMKKPIIYRGTNNNGEGHAFVCDGYMDTAFFHFNWGWGGSGNGYYFLGNANPSISFYWYQGAILNLNPYWAAYCDTVEFRQQAWTITDGSGPNYYWNNSSCTWLIAPDSAEKIDLHFISFMTEPEKDILYVYDGTDDTAPLLGSFSGFSLPYDLQSTGGALFLKFVTDDETQYLGWEVQYSVNTTAVNTAQKPNISLYPNPAADKVLVNHGINCQLIEIVSMQGKKLCSADPGDCFTEVNLQNLETGVYLLRCSFNNGIIVQRLVIE